MQHGKPPRAIVYGVDTPTVILSAEAREARTRRARGLLAAWRGPPFEERWEKADLEPLQVSTKAEVYLARRGGERVVVKLHNDEQSFTREHFALVLMGGAGKGPILLAESDEERLFVLEQAPEEFELVGGDDVEEIARALGAHHAAAAGAQGLLRELFPDATLESHLGASAGLTWLSDIPAAQRALRLMIAERGPGYVPFALGDIKAGHVRRRRDGVVCFLDLECAGPWPLEALDILSLLNLARAGLRPDRPLWARVIRAYLAGRGERPDVALEEVNMDILRWTAASIGRSELVP